jgi:hypothetical protein
VVEVAEVVAAEVVVAAVAAEVAEAAAANKPGIIKTYNLG